jgi:GNAT superfamily N-acetyltransferase
VGQLIVQRVAAADVDALVALCAEHADYERSGYECADKVQRLSAALFGPAQRLFAWIAIFDGSPVGYATAAAEYSTWSACEYLHMDCLFVSARRRGAGVGAALLNSVVQLAGQRGFTEVRWQTPQWNIDASRFYRRHGGVDQPKLRFVLNIGAQPD